MARTETFLINWLVTSLSSINKYFLSYHYMPGSILNNRHIMLYHTKPDSFDPASLFKSVPFYSCLTCWVHFLSTSPSWVHANQTITSPPLPNQALHIVTPSSDSVLNLSFTWSFQQHFTRSIVSFFEMLSSLSFQNSAFSGFPPTLLEGFFCIFASS